MTKPADSPDRFPAHKQNPSAAVRRAAWATCVLVGLGGCDRQVPKAPLQLRVDLETQGCGNDLQEVVVQLDQHSPSRGTAYRFNVDPTQQRLDATIGDLPEGTYHATVTGRTRANQNTCSQGAVVLVSSRGTGRAQLKLTCQNACEDLTPVIQAVECPQLGPSVPAPLQFTTLPFQLTANAKNASKPPLWSSTDLKLSSPQGERVQAQCNTVAHSASATVTASNSECSVSETVNVKCVKAETTVLDASNSLTPNWAGRIGQQSMPVTRGIYPTSCNAVVSRKLASPNNCTPVGPNFCSCEWTGRGLPSASDLPVSYDGPVLGGAAAEPVTEEQLSQLRRQLAEVGRKYLGVAPAVGTDAGATANRAPSVASSVRVAVIDTTKVPPYDLQSGLPTEPTDNNQHGRAVALVIADTACSEFGTMTQCPVKVHSYLALNVLGSHDGTSATLGVDAEHGGHAGTLTDLSLAILQAVNDWKQGSSEAHLIVNISAGWDPVWGGAADPAAAPIGGTAGGETISGAPAMVLASLKYASCHGALVFAAAGNRTTPYGSETPENAIYPAAWTRLSAPSAEECEAMGVKGAAEPAPGTPLLHAVGGLDLEGKPLMTSRSGALPLLATVGLNVVRQEPYGRPQYAPLLTGTSMSTAAVSGVAAYIWDRHQEWTHQRVARELLVTGQPTTLTANLCSGAASCKPDDVVRNVVLCSAKDGPQPPGCATTPLLVPAVPMLAPEQAKPISMTTDPAGTTPPSTPPQPWVYPQPPDDPSCRVCQFLNPSDKLEIAWNSSFDPSRVQQLRVYLNRNSGYWAISDETAKKSQFKVVLSGAHSKTTAGTIQFKYVVGPSVVTIQESLVVPVP